MSALLSIGSISAKYVPLENTCAYWFLSKYFTRPSMVSVSHMPVKLLVCITLFSLYCLARGITDEQVSLFVFLEIVYLACLRPICHRSLISSGDTVELSPFDWNVLAFGTYCTVAFASNTFLDYIKSTLTLPIIWLGMAPMSYIWYTEYLSLSVLVGSGDPTSVITATRFLDIYSSTVHKILGTRTFYGSHSWPDKQVACGNVCSSLYVGFILMTPSLVTLEDNRSI